MKKLIYIFAGMVILSSCGTKNENNEENTSADDTAVVEETAPNPIEGKVFFLSPAEGDTVSSPLEVKMGVEGMQVQPAGQVVEGTGHHHLIIDGNYIEKGSPVPADETHIHYGDGSTETTLELSPGTHTITMQFADGVHMSYGMDWSATVTVVVVE